MKKKKKRKASGGSDGSESTGKRILKFSKGVVIVMFAESILFTVSMAVIYVITGGVPDTLITEFFGFFKLEGGALGIIKVAETIVEKLTKGKDKNEI